METQEIKYNLKDRGRQFRGSDRNFNVRALVGYINGGECQERVKNRDMQGFYGHLVRQKFGIEPSENHIDGEGKFLTAEPAFVTTLLKADENGTVTHKAEFLPTEKGLLASQLYQGRTGGFSSAINNTANTFHGFDYVLEPNFTSNRGYTFDDVKGMSFEDLDIIAHSEMMRAMQILLDSANSRLDFASRALERATTDNEDLIDRLARMPKQSEMVLDSVRPKGDRDAKERLLKDCLDFSSAALPKVIDSDNQRPTELPSLAKRILRGY